MVEAQPELPVLPRQQAAVEGEAGPVRLDDLQRLHLARRQAGERGQVLAPHVGLITRPAVVQAVLDLQQRHAVQVEDRVQPADVVGVRAAPLAAAVPDVRPAEPQAPVSLGDERGAVAPHVGQHQGQVGDPAAGQRLGQRGMTAEHLVALMPFVHRHVRLLAGQVVPRHDPGTGQGHHRPVGPAAGPVPAHHDRLAAGQLARLESRQVVLARFPELNRRESPAGAHPAVPPQDRGCLPDFPVGQRIQRMRNAGAGEGTDRLRRAGHDAPPLRRASQAQSWPILPGQAIRGAGISRPGPGRWSLAAEPRTEDSRWTSCRTSSAGSGRTPRSTTAPT